MTQLKANKKGELMKMGRKTDSKSVSDADNLGRQNFTFPQSNR